MSIIFAASDVSTRNNIARTLCKMNDRDNTFMRRASSITRVRGVGICVEFRHESHEETMRESHAIHRALMLACGTTAITMHV